MSETSSYGFDTLQIHAGARPDPATGARQTPIYQTTAYVFRDADHAAALFNLQEVGYIYSRLTNPTVAVLQERIATLEGGVGAVCCSSGHAAQIMALFPLMAPGQERRRLDPALRRHGHPVQPDHQALRLVGEVRRFRRSGRGQGGDRRQHPRDLLRIDRQPRRLYHRPRRDRQDRRRAPACR